MPSAWYAIKNRAASAPEICLYDEIGVGGVRAADFAKDLKALGSVRAITLRIDSAGGEIFDGLAIFNLLREHPAAVTVKVDGVAASIASVIAMAGNRVVMPENSLLMMHDPTGGLFGASSDFRQFAAVLDKLKASLVSTYQAKSGLPARQIAEMMAAETWLNGAEAKAKGLADEVVLPPAEPSARFDPQRLGKFSPPAAKLAALAGQPIEPARACDCLQARVYRLHNRGSQA